MPRPTRIEYEGAFHHVMNRARAHQTIFHDKAYFEAFLYTLEEVSTQFDAGMQSLKEIAKAFELTNSGR